MLENIHAENINTDNESTNKTKLIIDFDLNLAADTLSEINPQPSDYTFRNEDNGDVSVLDGNGKVLVTIRTDDPEGETRTICLTIPKDDTQDSQHKTISLDLL